MSGNKKNIKGKHVDNNTIEGVFERKQKTNDWTTEEILEIMKYRQQTIPRNGKVRYNRKLKQM